MERVRTLKVNRLNGAVNTELFFELLAEECCLKVNLNKSRNSIRQVYAKLTSSALDKSALRAKGTDSRRI